jgi:hypothetical protein
MIGWFRALIEHWWTYRGILEVTLSEPPRMDYAGNRERDVRKGCYLCAYGIFHR